mgnify:FL=1
MEEANETLAVKEKAPWWARRFASGPAGAAAQACPEQETVFPLKVGETAMDQEAFERLCGEFQKRLAPGLAESVREAAAKAVEQALAPTVQDDHATDGRADAEIQSLVRQCDSLGLIRDQLELRAGRRRRQRRQWRAVINTVTNLIQANMDRLQQLGVTPMPRPERLDYTLHNPVHVYETSDPSQDGRIVEVYRSGFMRDGRAWRPMLVAVTAYRPAPTEKAQTRKEN